MGRRMAIPIGLTILIVGVTVYWVVTGGMNDSGPLSGGRSHPASVGDSVPQHTAAGDARGEAPARTTPAKTPAAVSAAVLFGRVTDASGDGIAAARVLAILGSDISPLLRAGERLEALRRRALGEVRPERRRLVGQTATDVGGSYSLAIASLPPGQFQIVVCAPGRAPETKSWTWAASSSRLDFQLGPGSLISGLVLAPDGESVPDATVEAVRESDGSEPDAGFEPLAALTTTQSDGRFLLHVSEGSFTLTAAASGFASTEAGEIAAGSDIVMNLARGKVLRGVARDLTDQPVVGASVALYSNRRSRARGPRRRSPLNELQRKMFFAPLGRLRTNEQGQFAFVDVAPGPYMILFEKPGFQTTEESVVVLDEPEATESDVVLMRSKVIRGRVSDGTGKSVAAAFVVLGHDRRTSDADRWRQLESRKRRVEEEGRLHELARLTEKLSALQEEEDRRRLWLIRQPISLEAAVEVVKTDSGGEFRIDTLGEGTYVLTVQSGGFVTYRKEGIHLEGETEIDIVLTRGLRLAGRVLSSVSGQTVPGATIVMSSGEEMRTARANRAGEYAVSGLTSQDSWTLQAYAQGYIVAYLDDLQIEPSPEVQNRDLHLDPAAVVSGRVVDPSGAPVSRARVRMEVITDDVERGVSRQSPYGVLEKRGVRRSVVEVETSTQSAGLFVLTGVPAAPAMVLSVSTYDYRRYRSEPFDVRSGERIENLEIRLELGGRVVVRVTGMDGEPLTGVYVRLDESPRETDRGRARRRRNREKLYKRCDGSGDAVFAGLSDGWHVVSSGMRGFQPFRDTVNVVSGATVVFAMELRKENVITGIVVDTSGAPVAKARLRATAVKGSTPEENDTTGLWPEPGSTTEKDGRFTLGRLGPGPYDLLIDRREFIRNRLDAIEVNTTHRIELQRAKSEHD